MAGRFTWWKKAWGRSRQFFGRAASMGFICVPMRDATSQGLLESRLLLGGALRLGGRYQSIQCGNLGRGGFEIGRSGPYESKPAFCVTVFPDTLGIPPQKGAETRYGSRRIQHCQVPRENALELRRIVPTSARFARIMEYAIHVSQSRDH